MTRQNAGTVHELVEEARRGGLSRRRLIAGLVALGVTSGGAAAIAAVALRPTTQDAHRTHLKLHDSHVARQVQGDVPSMMSDYHQDAVVEDPLFEHPFVGIDAIAARYAAEVASVPDRALTISQRTMAGDELVVEWVATGTHTDDFLGFGGTGRPFRLAGVTVVRRQDGKIVRESHYYDVESFRRQVEG